MAQSISANPVDFQLRNRGPWTTVEINHWNSFSLGLTTALTGGAGGEFENANKSELFCSLLPGESFHEPEQVHGTTVRTVKKYSACYLNTDGLVARAGGQTLIVQTADCLSIFIQSLSGNSFALLHAGWRGACGGILPEALKTFFSEPVRIIVGPGIKGSNYPVGTEVTTAAEKSVQLSAKELRKKKVIREGETNIHLDLLKLLEVQVEPIADKIAEFYYLPLYTGTERGVPLFSYRENKTHQRMLNWITKK